MNRIICLLTSLMLLVPRSEAQTLALVPLTVSQIQMPAISFTGGKTKYPPAKKVMIAGFIGMGAGATLFVVGVGAVISSNSITGSASPGAQNLQDRSNDQLRNVGTGLAIAGGILFVAGSGMAIGGGIASHPRHSVSLVIPKNNEIGIAYNF